MEGATVIPILPAGVQRITAGGSTSYVGIIDQDTYLKHLYTEDSQYGLMVEATMLRTLGFYPRIIELRG